MIRILIADDHDLFLDGLASVFEKNNALQVIGKVNTGEEALTHLAENECDVVLLDINMPGIGGMLTAERLISKYPKLKILMLTMIDNLAMIEKMISIGVHGYLLKTTSSGELFEAITNVYNGSEHYSKEVTSKLVQGLRREKTAIFNLTIREKEVLGLIAQGLRTSEIAKQLFISQHTVDSHRKNLLSKSGAKNAIDLINWARDNEYLV